MAFSKLNQRIRSECDRDENKPRQGWWPFATFDDAMSRCDAVSLAAEPTKLSGGFLNRTPMTKFIKSGEGPGWFTKPGSDADREIPTFGKTRTCV